MPRPQVTRPALAIAALALGACSLPLVESGRPPEGPTWDLETAESRATKARREEARHVRQDAEETGSKAPADADPTRVGSRTTQIFHRKTCEEAARIADEDRVEFASPWDAVNDNYTPCRLCDAFPR